MSQCADDQDAVCTRSVTLSLPSLENMTVKLKHGGVVSVNSMDIQTPMNHGVYFWYMGGKLHFTINQIILYCCVVKHLPNYKFLLIIFFCQT